MLSKTKTQFNFSKPIWNQEPKSIKHTDLFIPTSKKIKRLVIVQSNILKAKINTTRFPKNLPSKQDITRFENGRISGNKYIKI